MKLGVGCLVGMLYLLISHSYQSNLCHAIESKLENFLFHSNAIALSWSYCLCQEYINCLTIIHFEHLNNLSLFTTCHHESTLLVFPWHTPTFSTAYRHSNTRSQIHENYIYIHIDTYLHIFMKNTYTFFKLHEHISTYININTNIIIVHT